MHLDALLAEHPGVMFIVLVSVGDPGAEYGERDRDQRGELETSVHGVTP
jgi:hypothetical protein